MNALRKLIKKYSNMSVVMRASMVYLLVSVLQKGLGFITSPIYTRMLSSAEFGIVNVFLSMEQLIGTIAMFCLSAGCFDIGMQDYKRDRDSFCFSLLVLSNSITIVTGVILFAGYSFFGSYIEVSRHLLLLMFVIFLTQPAFLFWTRKERFEYNYRIPGILTAVSSVLSCVSAIICISIFSDNKVDARLFGQYAPLIILYIVFWFYLAKRARFRIKKEYIKFAFLFNLPLIPHYLSSYVLNASDRLMIDSLVGHSQAGYYSLAYSVSALVTIIWTAINSSMVPYILDKYEKKEYSKANSFVLPILVFFSVACLVFILVAPELIGILGTDEYKEAMYVIPPVIAGCFFQALYYVFTNVLYYLKKPRIVMYASVISAVLNIVLNYFCIQLFGYIAAGYTTLICFALQAIVDYGIVKRIMGMSVYNGRFLFLLSLVVIIVSLLCNLLYSFIVVRYVILCCVLIALWIKRKYIFRLLKKNDK